MSKEINSERNSAPTGAQDSESNSNADRPLGGAACSASDLLREIDGMYQTADGIPQASFGSSSSTKPFQVSYMGGSYDLLVVTKVDGAGKKMATLISDYQGLLELRDQVNLAYDSLYSYVSSQEDQS